MKTPREKYMNDIYYHELVDLMVDQIEQCRFTPSELREASTLASILYVERCFSPLTIHPKNKIEDALNTIKHWLDKKVL